MGLVSCTSLQLHNSFGFQHHCVPTEKNSLEFIERPSYYDMSRPRWALRYLGIGFTQLWNGCQHPCFLGICAKGFAVPLTLYVVLTIYHRLEIDSCGIIPVDLYISGATAS